MNEKNKKLGQVFTPRWIVDEILDSIGYSGEKILDKYIMEPASGDGIFLLSIIDRYINAAIKAQYSTLQIQSNLEKYIYAIELDTVEYKKSIENLNEFVWKKLGKKLFIKWQIYNTNTLFEYKKYCNFFDFVVGNPPYIRIHNLDIQTRTYIKNEFQFTDGTIDIYLSFFELGIKILNKNGKLGFITPNSFLHNSSYKKFRDYLKNTKAIQILIDLKANKVFKGFSTYTAISIIQFHAQNDSFTYKELVNGQIKTINKINYKEVNSADWSFSNDKDNKFISKISKSESIAIKEYFNVQYGFATLRDKIFIANAKENDSKTVYFNGQLIEKGILRKIVKGSTFRGDISEFKSIIFPYIKKNDRYFAIDERDLENKFPLTYKYLLNNKSELLTRDLDKGAKWYEFGRSQGVQTIHNEKIVCSTLMKDSINFYKLPDDVMVYSGLYIIKRSPSIDWNIIENILSSVEFMRYIKITGKDFSGGYKSITSKQIKEFKLEGVSCINQNKQAKLSI